MSVKVAEHHAVSDKELRKEFCETLLAMAAEDEKVVVLDADLMNAAGTKPFQAAYPERTLHPYVWALRGAAGLRPNLHVLRIRETECEGGGFGPRYHGRAERRHAYAL